MLGLTVTTTVLIIIACFDLYWILRLIVAKILSKFRTKLRPDEASVIYNICWTTDIDYFLHMNNGKYFREMDFGRFDFYFRTGFNQYIVSQKKMYFVQHGASIRYRRSIDFLVPFKLETRLVWWDERSLYFEQKFISLHDGFVRAIALCKNTAVGGTIQEMLSSLRLPVTPPSPPPEIELWIKSQEISSSRLRLKPTSSDSNDGKLPKNEDVQDKSNVNNINNDSELKKNETSADQGEWEVLDGKIKSKDA